ncbi:nicotinate phosphoribosyltransferase [Alkalibacter rhizosphaerae]|uniref:Nicotinate phosphoribosyltransferase n=1 Tax=Alkalibacter rhizosphaerae TaxID=2815577 RepID=A0A975AHN1_9FIRM|nr:nicotinate phosphoribosyltransferase [Alkalibacter rhizosphaerae]QSX07794.1 nicotinate phosphoribosyltransferase [Alkalibacter rhizosphaerae]
MKCYRHKQLATDYYQISMSNVYINEGKDKDIAVFDMFVRNNPFNGGYIVCAGLEQVVQYLMDLKFEEEDIEMLRENHPELTEVFLDYLRDFRFTGELCAIPEGTILFPHEPILRVKAPLLQAQIVETALLSIINHQTLIATKAARIVQAAEGDPVLEFGLRRAHGSEAGLYGARAAVIGGCLGTSNVESETLLSIPSKGTMSHSYILSFDTEYESFMTYTKYNPNNLILLVDTYNTLKSGVPNAIKVFQQLKEEDRLPKMYGIRLDSGDLAYLSKEAKAMLDAHGFEDAVISASSDLDEYLIRDLKLQGSTINLWGVGTKLITAYDQPALGAVYKLAQVESDGKIYNKLKISNDPGKITNPGYKKVVRLYDNETGKALADLIMLVDETVDETKPLTIFHPIHTWKKRELTDFHAKQLMVPVLVDGELVYDLPTVTEIREHLKEELESMWPATTRFTNPHEYHVDLSDKLWNLKNDILNKR